MILPHSKPEQVAEHRLLEPASMLTMLGKLLCALVHNRMIKKNMFECL